MCIRDRWKRIRGRWCLYCRDGRYARALEGRGRCAVDLSKEYAYMLFESQCVRKLIHWYGEPHVSALGNKSIDMGSPMSVVGKTTHWHGETHVSAFGNRSIDMGSPMAVSRKSPQIAPLTWGAPCQCVRKLVHWHGEPHVSALGNRSIDMGSHMSVIGKSYSDAKLFPGPLRNTIHIRSSVIVRNLYGIWYIGI